MFVYSHQIKQTIHTNRKGTKEYAEKLSLLGYCQDQQALSKESMKSLMEAKEIQEKLGMGENDVEYSITLQRLAQVC